MNTRARLGLAIFAMSLNAVCGDDSAFGIFSHHADIGNTGQTGTAQFDRDKGIYVVSGGGADIWGTNDAFHFVWREASGDLRLGADVRLSGTGTQRFRKACLMIRQSLDPDSAYVDAALHGDGLASLQYRDTTGGLTREIKSNITRPARLRLEKRGDYVFMSAAQNPGDPLRPAGGSFRIAFKAPFYVGLAVCAHDNRSLEPAEFSRVELAPVSPARAVQPTLQSTLEVYTLSATDRRVIHHTTEHIEAPNWSRAGFLIFNRAGRLCKIPVTGGDPQELDTGGAVRCNNDHGISPDGLQLAISDQTGDGKSRISIVPIAGGQPRQITPLGPSYWHGWSPDGRTLAYCAERDGKFGIFVIPASGGDEKRLTTAPGLDDGPDYSSDGRWIYFNSDRTGRMQIWRMRPDGSELQQITSDEFNNWFPHPSPDGRWLVFLSYGKDVKGHPPNQDVSLRLMPAGGGAIQEIVKLFGGQGTINVPSWSPDSRQIAFVSYLLVPP